MTSETTAPSSVKPSQQEVNVQIMKEDLLEALKTVSGVIESSHVIQILSFVRLIGEGSSLKMMTSNSEVQLESSAPIAGSIENSFDLAVPCKKLLSITKNLPDNILMSICYEDNWLTVKTESSSFQLATLPSSQFPEFNTIEAVSSYSLTEAELKDLLEKTSFSMAQQDVRFFLNGLLIESSENHIEAVATDGHRMAFGSLKVIKNTPIRAIIPRKTIYELQRLLTESDSVVEMNVSASSIKIKTPQFTLLSNLIDGNFPNCHQLIPKKNNLLARIGVADLKRALSRVSILANEKFKGAKLSFSNHSLNILSSNVEHEKAEETLTIHYEGAPLTIAFNINYIQEVLQIITTEEVCMALSTADQCVLITDSNGSDDYQYVIMPLTL
ncbi:MAG TPA: DNA polymerase III subunit beta [Gammaproteobacteria bacterium]|nr:DNA polymerase III subunit beta [Gammaproteobacteria bacterium]